MKASTTILAICLSLLAFLAAPIVTHPMPDNIMREGRDFNSRFAPIARPVFPRSYYDNTTEAGKDKKPKTDKPTKVQLTPVKKEYPAGPTASVFRDEPKDFKPKKETKPVQN